MRKELLNKANLAWLLLSVVSFIVPVSYTHLTLPTTSRV